jgi:hypothetical protein
MRPWNAQLRTRFDGTVKVWVNSRITSTEGERTAGRDGIAIDVDAVLAEDPRMCDRDSSWLTFTRPSCSPAGVVALPSQSCVGTEMS